MATPFDLPSALAKKKLGNLLWMNLGLYSFGKCVS